MAEDEDLSKLYGTADVAASAPASSHPTEGDLDDIYGESGTTPVTVTPGATGGPSDASASGTTAPGQADAGADGDDDFDEEEPELVLNQETVEQNAALAQGIAARGTLNIRGGFRNPMTSSAGGSSAGRGQQRAPQQPQLPGPLAGLPQGGRTGRSVLEYDATDAEDRPWRKPGVDISDYFNYGFTEESWRAYCAKQVQLRQEYANMGKIRTWEKNDSQYELPPELREVAEGGKSQQTQQPPPQQNRPPAQFSRPPPGAGGPPGAAGRGAGGYQRNPMNPNAAGRPPYQQGNDGAGGGGEWAGGEDRKPQWRARPRYQDDSVVQLAGGEGHSIPTVGDEAGGGSIPTFDGEQDSRAQGGGRGGFSGGRPPYRGGYHGGGGGASHGAYGGGGGGGGGGGYDYRGAPPSRDSRPPPAGDTRAPPAAAAAPAGTTTGSASSTPAPREEAKAGRDDSRSTTSSSSRDRRSPSRERDDRDRRSERDRSDRDRDRDYRSKRPSSSDSKDDDRSKRRR